MIDPVELQVVTGALRACCEEMGAALIRSAHSPNIKERRDCSTALFDAHGEMVMQAEHIPVHLGSMPDAVAAVLAADHERGASWILNDPFAGGTHLPDITVITPIFIAERDVWHDRRGEGGVGAREGAHRTGEGAHRTAEGAHRAGEHLHRTDEGAPRREETGRTDTMLGFAVSRAHHADVGSSSPGSMPADSRTLAEEGVVIEPQLLTEALIERLAAATRNPHERRADLRAQLAANRIGVLRVQELARRIGTHRLSEANEEVLAYAERRMRARLEAMPDGVREAEDVLEAQEGDLTLRLRAVLTGESLVLDFTGSAAQHAGNLNCPLSVTKSACMFAVRVLTDPEIPASTGAFRPLRVIAPEGCLLNALPGAAVAGGNVETSSRVADLVLCAFGRALGQGTMNNLALGDEKFAYYETIGGGQGACPDADGPSAVHVAMSNTLNTPIEALERELPLRITTYAVRRSSGGAGLHRGGDGVVREIEALRGMSFSLITERRLHRPRGAAGGEPGQAGHNLLIRTDGSVEDLPAKARGLLAAGERLRIETPGGGGFGTPPEKGGAAA